MKPCNNSQSKINSKIITISAAITAFFVSHPAYAKLDNAKQVLEKFKKNLLKKLSPLPRLLYFYA